MAVNTNYDAQFCGNLAIHQTNSIQDYGYLVVLDRSSLEVIQASENIVELMGGTVEEFIGHSFGSLVSGTDFKAFSQEIRKGERDRLPFQFDIHTQSGAEPFHLLAHVKAAHVILEIEQAGKDAERSFSKVFQEVRSFISTIELSGSLDEVCKESISEIRRIAGFDGIRMYRFDKDWNGTVIAEEISGTLESYLGQTFPASDVPRQARALYVKNPFRLIPNRNYTAFRLYPVMNQATNSFTDLSDCNLRSVARVHLEYMANMGVEASMSIRVMVKGALWGLISCHHITSKYLNMETRAVFEWLSMEISYRISSIIIQQELQDSAALSQRKAQIIENILTRGNIVQGILEDENQNLLSLFNASGFVISLNGKLHASGTVPQRDDLDNLLMWVEGKQNGKIYYSASLGDEHEEAKAFADIASGILVIPIRGSHRDFVICFRPEAILDIKWGGDPGEAINFEKDGQRYHPRNSFKLWLQTVYGQSVPFSAMELETAESLRNFFFEFSSTQLLN